MNRIKGYETLKARYVKLVAELAELQKNAEEAKIQLTAAAEAAKLEASELIKRIDDDAIEEKP